jgi:hypothetical protein
MSITFIKNSSFPEYSGGAWLLCIYVKFCNVKIEHATIYAQAHAQSQEEA